MKPFELTSAEPEATAPDGCTNLRPSGRRECHCPEWVIRCAHFGDQTITMFEWLSVPLGSGRYAVARNKGPVQVGHCTCGECSTFVYANGNNIRGGPSEAEALAAFYEAEHELLETARALA